MAPQDPDPSQTIFQRLKLSCVPLLGNSVLTAATSPVVSGLLQDLVTTLRGSENVQPFLTPSIAAYVFFPLSVILKRNPTSTIPDHILERLLNVVSMLCENWWWDIDLKTWEYLFMLSSTIIGGLGQGSEGQRRDNETTMAAVQCLWTLLRERSPQDDPLYPQVNTDRTEEVFSRFQTRARAEGFLPVIGQSVNSLLLLAESAHRPLQVLSLKVLRTIIKDFTTEGFVPSILPGVTSSTCKIALGVGLSRGWASGDVVAAALMVMRETIISSVSDEACIRDGAVKTADDLESLTQLPTGIPSRAPSAHHSRFYVLRSPAWLGGTATQLHIVLKALQPLVTHPTPSSQTALASFSGEVLQATTSTLPQSQSLLLSYLLSLSACSFPGVASCAKESLQSILTAPRRHIFLRVLLQISKDNLTSLPRFLSTHSETKLEHAAGIVEALCDLASSPSRFATPISTEIENLLGPNGGVEKWGWNLLPLLEFTLPPDSVSTSFAHSFLTGGGEVAPPALFPECSLRYLSSPAQLAIERMFRSLGRVAGHSCIYTVEWFFNFGRNGREASNVTALWCAFQLLQGATGIFLANDTVPLPGSSKVSKRFEKLARHIARSATEVWDDPLERAESQDRGIPTGSSEIVRAEHITGLLPVRHPLTQRATLPSTGKKPGTPQDLLHKVMLLQLLALASGVLNTRFTSTFLHTLYPILRSLVSPVLHLSTAALAALQYVANATAYASPANLLLANFDYALDAVSRRLNQRWLDVDATSVLVMLVRLVGRNVVDRAGDVVEECFDRLDEYHGYEAVADGLISVLAEVVTAIAEDDSQQNTAPESPQAANRNPNQDPMTAFAEWFAHRHTPPNLGEAPEDKDPAPQQAQHAENEGERGGDVASDPLNEPPSTPTQLLVQQVVTRSIYFLTHESRLIRSRILGLLTSAATVLPAPLILPPIHHAWPFVLNRLTDSEPFVASASATLVEALASHFGDFMSRRLWDDVWPRFRERLKRLEAADAGNALARRGPGAVGTESAYTHSHRLYRAILRITAAAVRAAHVRDGDLWDVTLSYRRFLHQKAHEELQSCARALYSAIRLRNEDAVWFALVGTQGTIGTWTYLQEHKWDIKANAEVILYGHPSLG